MPGGSTPPCCQTTQHNDTGNSLPQLPGPRRSIPPHLTTPLELMARPRIKVRSSVDQRMNKLYKQLTRHEIKSVQIRLDMSKIPTS